MDPVEPEAADPEGDPEGDPDGDPERRVAARLAEMADRLDNLAEMAELMDDDDGAARFRAAGARCRHQAMELLDEQDR